MRSSSRARGRRWKGWVMATEPKAPAVEEVNILWISEGMSCDGDSVSVTAAGQPGIEDVVLGAIPGLPKVNLHNKVLSPTLGGEEFLLPFRRAVNDELDAPFVLVIEGSIPNEKINGEGYWTSFGNDEATGEPLTINWWIDQLAPKAWGVVAVGTCATYGGIHPMAGNPTGCMGLADYLGWDFRSEAGKIVDMAWDPITRIVGNLGIYTKIDFANREVVSCKSTSSLFRGYSVFMKGKDPRDAG